MFDRLLEDTQNGYRPLSSWWRHKMETFSAVLALRERNSPVDSFHKGQWRAALMFSFICAWANGWVNNLDAGDLTSHPLWRHCNVTTATWPCRKLLSRWLKFLRQRHVEVVSQGPEDKCTHLIFYTFDVLCTQTTTVTAFCVNLDIAPLIVIKNAISSVFANMFPLPFPYRHKKAGTTTPSPEPVSHLPYDGNLITTFWQSLSRQWYWLCSQHSHSWFPSTRERNSHSGYPFYWHFQSWCSSFQKLHPRLRKMLQS